MDNEEIESMHQHEKTHWWYVALHVQIERALKSFLHDKKANIIDCGCGTGEMLSILLKKFPLSSFIGIDYAKKCCLISKSKTDLNIIRADNNNLPFTKEYFDVAISADVIYHESIDPHASLKEIYSILKQGGLLIINVAAYEWLKGPHDKRGGGARRFLMSRLKTKLENLGYVVIYATYWNTLLFPIMVLWRKVLGKYDSGSDVRSMPIIDNMFEKIMNMELFLINKGVKLPFGGSIFMVAKKG